MAGRTPVGCSAMSNHAPALLRRAVANQSLCRHVEIGRYELAVLKLNIVCETPRIHRPVAYRGRPRARFPSFRGVYRRACGPRRMIRRASRRRSMTRPDATATGPETQTRVCRLHGCRARSGKTACGSRRAPTAPRCAAAAGTESAAPSALASATERAVALLFMGIVPVVAKIRLEGGHRHHNRLERSDKILFGNRSHSRGV